MGGAVRLSLPMHFGGNDDPLFGWFHPPRVRVRATGVVLCNPIGEDYVRAHRALRHLAERLQQAGFPVVRFDFHGTGDSSGDEAQPGRVRRWLDDIGRAADELRARGGVERVALVGLELGATLALLAAARRDDVAAVVAWSPYLDGLSFIDEARRRHRLHKQRTPHDFSLEPRGWRPPGDEALGFLLTPETIAELEAIDLLRSPRPAPRVLVVGTGDIAAEASLCEHLQGLGVETAYRHLPGTRVLVTTPAAALLPESVLYTIVDWCGAALPELAPTTRAPAPPSVLPAFAEEPLVFGDGDALFGLLTRPPSSLVPRERPAIVLLPAGTVHRIGPHRFYVRLARRWAALGFHVLRVDLSGIGDSGAAPGAEENQAYPPNGLAEVQAAMDAVARATGITRFVLGGLSSGGDLAFQTALRDPRVAGAILINPRSFCVNDVELVDTYARARDYVDALGGAGRLARLWRADAAVGRAVGVTLANVRRVWRRRRDIAGVGDSMSDVPACLRLIAEAGVDTLLVASEHDPGVEYVDRRFARQMRALGRLRNFTRADFRGTDHTFTSLYAQELVAATISDHLLARHTP